MQPRCLLDIDGVIGDFNRHACELHGMPIPNWEVVRESGTTDYLPDYCMKSAKEFYAPMGEEFWESLPLMDDAIDILNHVEECFGVDNIVFLTSPLLTPGCVEGKIKWIKKNFPAYGKRYYVGPSKYPIAHPDFWLIDDRNSIIDQYFNAGGVNQILVPRPWNRNYHHQTIPYLRKRLLEVHTNTPRISAGAYDRLHDQS